MRCASVTICSIVFSREFMKLSTQQRKCPTGEYYGMQRSSQPVNPRVMRIATCVFLLMTFIRRGVLAQQSSSSIQVSRVDAPSLVVSDMDRAVAFYSQVLSFEKVSDVEVFGDAYEHLEGLFGIRTRVVRLR